MIFKKIPGKENEIGAGIPIPQKKKKQMNTSGYKALNKKQVYK